MREIQATTAEALLPQILDEVERGETVVITRHGRPIARIVPEGHGPTVGVDRAIAGIRALRKRTGRVTAEQLLAARDEGRRC